METGFTPQDAAWIDDPDEARRRLAEDPLHPLGFITDASNGAILCRLGDHDERLFAVYKPGVMERPLWDFPDGTLHQREVAAHLVSDALGWDLIPPTVLREDVHGGGSVQLFVPHDPAEHYFVLVETERWSVPLARLAMFDLLTNQADRKGGHILHQLGADRLQGIDNGLTFHPEPKVRTVVWDVDHVPFEAAWKADVLALCERLDDDDDPLAVQLHDLLTITEVRMLARRAAQVATMTAIPRIEPDHRHYPWPPI